MDDLKPFPIQGRSQYRNEDGELCREKKCTIPWWLAEEAYMHYAKMFGTDQSLERMAERGGLSC